MEGESGRNELLRGPFALFGVRNSAKLVRDLAKHRRTPMSPPQLIPPTSPGQVIVGDGRLRRSFSHTVHGPLRPLIVVALSGLDKVRPPHLTRETLSGRRPADGADTPGGVFRSGENLPGEGDTADIFRRRRRE